MSKRTLSSALDEQVVYALAGIDDGHSKIELLELLRKANPSFRRVKQRTLEESLDRALHLVDGAETRLSASKKSPTKTSADAQVSAPASVQEFPNQNASSEKSINQSIVDSWNFRSGASFVSDREPKESEASKRIQSLKRQSKSSSQMTNISHKRNKGWSTTVSQSLTLSDVGGMNDCIDQIVELIAMPLTHPEIYSHIGVHPPRGVLLYGPPGCGKTLLANAIAGELGIAFISVSAPSLVAGMSGESEKNVREIFEDAKAAAPCILFFDEIDAVTPKRESAQREMERRIVAQFLTCMDDLAVGPASESPVIVIGATNRPDSLDAALRRAGRFDREISLNVPDEAARAKILQILCKNMRLDGELDFRILAKMTPGYVGADLKALATAAGVIAIKRIFKQLNRNKEEMMIEDDSIASNGPVNSQTLKAVAVQFDTLNETTDCADSSNSSNDLMQFLKSRQDLLSEEELKPLAVTLIDFQIAIPQVQPSSKREGFTTVPSVSWNDIGALNNIRHELEMAIVQPIKNPELYQLVGISAPSGILLWGPPGCGKTLLAKAVANESSSNFISIRGPELLNKYVGESERAVRQVFLRARASAPCVIFFDELDALVPKRDEMLSEASSRVVNTLLTELDGLEERRGVYVIAATNRPDVIDPAMIRPGRLDKALFVDLPNSDEKALILNTICKRTPLADDIDLNALATDSRLNYFSGADLAALVREAAVKALNELLSNCNNDPLHKYSAINSVSDKENVRIRVCARHFDQALYTMKPSVSELERDKYLRIAQKFGISTK